MTLQILILVLVFLVVSGLAYGATIWLNQRAAIQDRLQQLDRGDSELDRDLTGDTSGVWQARVAKVAGPVASLSTPKEGWEASGLRIRFIQAGLRDPSWPMMFFTAKTLLAVLLPFLFIAIQSMRPGQSNMAGNTVLLLLLLLAAIGYYLPNVLLAQVSSRRKRDLMEALPDALDLMTVCVEAGLGLDAAMNRTAGELSLRSKELADEFNLVALELRAGVRREQAMHNFALRTGVDDIASFVSMIVQSDRFGTNVADALRIQADTMRVQRQLRAEERAAKIPLKLLFPLIFFIFPALFVVLIGPAAISIARILLPTLSGSR
jgi:tight adherence protein C